MAEQAKAKQPKPLFREYGVEWQFLGMLCGSVPQSQEFIRRWLESRVPRVKPPEGRSLDEIQREVAETIAAGAEEEEIPEISVVGFQQLKAGIVLRADTIRAHLKECGRDLSVYVVGRVEGERSFSYRFQDCVRLPAEDYWIPIQRNGTQLAAEDDWIEKPMRVMTRQGPRSAFKRFAFVESPTIRFRLLILGGAVSREDLETVMRYGGIHGYGGERSAGQGRYTATVTEAPDESYRGLPWGAERA